MLKVSYKAEGHGGEHNASIETEEVKVLIFDEYVLTVTLDKEKDRTEVMMRYPDGSDICFEDILRMVKEFPVEL